MIPVATSYRFQSVKDGGSAACSRRGAFEVVFVLYKYVSNLRAFDIEKLKLFIIDIFAALILAQPPQLCCFLDSPIVRRSGFPRSLVYPPQLRCNMHHKRKHMPGTQWLRIPCSIQKALWRRSARHDIYKDAATKAQPQRRTKPPIKLVPH